MRCEDVQPWISAGQGSEKGAWRALRLWGHLRRCAACHAHLHATTALTARIKAADPLAGYAGSTYAPALRRFAFTRPAILAASLLIVAGVGAYRWMATSPPRTVVGDRLTSGEPQTVVRPQPLITSLRRAAVLPPTRKAAAPRRVRLGAPRIRLASAAPGRRRAGRRPRVRITLTQPPVARSPEVVEVSVKITDPHQVVREAREAFAEMARREASREYIYVVATPEAVWPLIPAARDVTFPSDAVNAVKEPL